MLEEVATSKKNSVDLSQEEYERLDIVLSRTESLLDDKIKKRDTNQRDVNENELLLQNIKTQLEEATSGAKIAGDQRLAAEKEKYLLLDDYKKETDNDTNSAKSSLSSLESSNGSEKKVIDIDNNLRESTNKGQIDAIDTSTTSNTTSSAVNRGDDGSTDNMISNEIENDEQKAAYEARLKANQLTADDKIKVDRIIAQRIEDAKNAFAARYNIQTTTPTPTLSNDKTDVATRNEAKGNDRSTTNISQPIQGKGLSQPKEERVISKQGTTTTSTTFADKNPDEIKGKGWGMEKQNLEAVKGKGWGVEKQQNEDEKFIALQQAKETEQAAVAKEKAAAIERQKKQQSEARKIAEEKKKERQAAKKAEAEKIAMEIAAQEQRISEKIQLAIEKAEIDQRIAKNTIEVAEKTE